MVPAGDPGQLALPGDWADRLAGYAKEDQATATDAAGIPWLSLRGGRFSYGDDILDGPLPVVIMGAVRENLYYEKKFDPDNVSNPDCFAIGPKVDELAPPPELEGKQSDSCATCWANAFGSAPDGRRGKACGNKVRLVVLSHSGGKLNAAKVPDLQAARLRVPTMSLSNLSGYTSKVAKGLERPLFTVVSLLDLVPDNKSQFRLTFDLGAPINDGPTLEALEARMHELAPVLNAHPATGSDEDEKPKGGRRKVVRKKKVAKKKAGRKKKTTKKKSTRRRKF